MSIEKRLFLSAIAIHGVSVGLAFLLFLLITGVSRGSRMDGLAFATIFILGALVLGFHRLFLMFQKPLVDRYMSEHPKSEPPTRLIGPKVLSLLIGSSLLCFVPGYLILRDKHFAWWLVILPWIGLLLAILAVRSMQKAVAQRRAILQTNAASPAGDSDVAPPTLPNLWLFFLFPIGLALVMICATIVFQDAIKASRWFGYLLLAIILWTFWFLRSRMISRRLARMAQGNSSGPAKESVTPEQRDSLRRTFMFFALMQVILFIGSIALFAGLYLVIAVGNSYYAILGAAIYALSLFAGHLVAVRSVFHFAILEPENSS
jgi:hypothetical protein